MNKDPQIYIRDIILSCDRIAQYIDKKTSQDFKANDELQDAVIRRLLIIGEAVKKLPKEFREKHINIEWRKASAMRDVLVHDYDDIDIDRVWLTISSVIPSFKMQIEKLISQ